MDKNLSELKEKQRIEWVDVAKCICILFVMASHLESMTLVFRKLYSPFFLTLFFFCSGYVYKHKCKFSVHIVSKIRQLFVPWLVFSVINILLSQVLTFNEHKELATELFWNFIQIRGNGDGIWFVAALFVAYIPFYFFIGWYENKAYCKKRVVQAVLIAYVLSLISVIYCEFTEPSLFPWNSTNLPWHLEYIFQAMFYMALGYFFRITVESKLEQYNTIKFRVLLWVMYLLLIYVPVIFKVEMAPLLEIGYDYICQILGVFSVIVLCKTIKANHYLLYVGQNTLVYFALHGKVLSIIQAVMRRILQVLYELILSNVMTSTLFCVLLTLLISVILILPTYIINRCFPFLLGRKKVVHK